MFSGPWSHHNRHIIIARGRLQIQVPQLRRRLKIALLLALHLLLVRLPLLALFQLMTRDAAADSPKHGMMAGIMPGNGPHGRAGHASGGEGR
ncbi:hypothetical protein [Acidocella facilis]|uniref:hypothetical protein n=1 Tax=Acidocella facilis TaxID=525 RepID=UPI001F1B3DD8|nr:hypothetical protein [Acidocella facilis]